MILTFRVIVLLTINFVPVGLGVLTGTLVSFITTVRIRAFHGLHKGTCTDAVYVNGVEDNTRTLYNCFGAHGGVLLVGTVRCFDVVFVFTMNTKFNDLTTSE